MVKGRVTGAVLCGGESRRMGLDKAKLPLGDATLLECAARVLDGVCDEVVLACGSSERYAELGLRLLVDRIPGAGPLAGLEVALADAPGSWVCVLACDMPLARSAVFERLIESARARDLDACLLRSAGGLEPLYGVYHVRCLAAVEAALARGKRRVIAFNDFALESGELPRIGWLEESKVLAGKDDSVATNVNTPEDYAARRKSHGLSAEKRV